MNYLRPFAEDEEVVYGFDEESPFSFPAIDALLPLIRRCTAQSTDERAGSYTPEEEDAEVDRSPRPEAPAQAKICATRGYSRRWCKGKGKEANNCHFGTGHGKHVGALPKISAELERLSDRQIALEARLQEGGHHHCP